MSLQNLQVVFTEQMQEDNGNIIVSAASLIEAQLIPADHFDSLIQSYLMINTDLRVHVDTNSIPDPVGNTLTILGTACFLNMTDLEITLIFTVNSDNITHLLLTADLGNTWSFTTSFPTLSGYPINALNFSVAQYCFTTQLTESYIWQNTTLTLMQGLNFTSNLILDGPWSLIQAFVPTLTDQEEIIFSGTINPTLMNLPEMIYPEINLQGFFPAETTVTIPHYEASHPYVAFIIDQSTTTDDSETEEITFNIWIYFGVLLQVGEDHFPFQTPLLENSASVAFGLTVDSTANITAEAINVLLGYDVNFAYAIPEVMSDLFTPFSLKGFTASFYIDNQNVISSDSLSLTIGASDVWTLGTFTIEEIDLRYSVYEPFTVNESTLSSFTASFTFYPDSLFPGVFLVEMMEQTENALSVSASYSGDVSLNDIVNVMSNGTITIPDQMLDIVFSDFGVSFITSDDASTYNFYGQATIDFPLAILGTSVTSNFQISVEYTNGKNNFQLSGGLTIGSSYFTATLDLSDDGKQILETRWQALNSQYLGINDLIMALGFKDFLIPAGIDLNLYTASFDYDFEKCIMTLEAESVIYGKAIFISQELNGKWEYVFAFALNTDCMSIDSLPLFGDFPPDQQIGLSALQITGASNPIPQDQLDAWNALAAKYGFIFPDDMTAAGASITATVALGSFGNYPLFLPLSTAEPPPPTGYSSVLAATAAVENPLIIWISIQNSLGPLYFNRVGFSYQSETFNIFLDASVELTGLRMTAIGLGVRFPLEDVLKITYSIDGLDIDFQQAPVQISGGLLKTNAPSEPLAFSGQAILSMTDLKLVGLGSYTTLDNCTSLFIIAILNKMIGGTPYFYVTGLSAGFGYNRTLKIPIQSEVQNFPLVAGLTDPSKIGGTNPTPEAALATLVDWTPPQQGEYWLAFGVQGTTFEIMNTNALFVVEFGNDTVIAIIGISTLKQPQEGSTFVYAELDMSASFKPNEGEINITATLASSSYVLTRDAHLTGGFAFSSWFGNSIHAGDFVLTMGGYSPNFDIPDYYPIVPPLGVNWKISSCITMEGSAYFAIIPTAMMAGTDLQLTYHDGGLKAWLKAKTDVVLFWKPFYFIADVSVSVGVSYHMNVMGVSSTLSVEVGANFHLWGPEMGASVYIDWCVISFTIEFGPKKHAPNSNISWDEFKKMLPSKTEVQSTSTHTLTSESESTTPGYIHIDVNQGLLSTQTQGDVTLWLVRAEQFQFSVDSAIPASTIEIDSLNPEDNQIIPGEKVGICSVDGGISPEDYQSTQIVNISILSNNELSYVTSSMLTHKHYNKKLHDEQDNLIDLSDWEVTVIKQNMPPAMWSDPNQESLVSAEDNTVIATTGVSLKPKPPVITNCTPEMVIDEVFELRVINPEDEYRLSVSPSAVPDIILAEDADSFKNIAEIEDPNVASMRENVYETLVSLGIEGLANDSLAAMAANPGAAFIDEPMLGSTAI